MRLRRNRQNFSVNSQKKAFYPLFATLILFGLLEADHQRNMRWHFYPLKRLAGEPTAHPQAAPKPFIIGL
jgi:hypothetical protein